MPLTPGTTLGPYEIESPLGAGGMGEVYTARDTRLDRIVAVKVLPAHIAADPDARQRFEREAKAVAALNHPHICTLHDIGSQEPSTGSGPAVDYLVMEHLDGESLAERLERGAVPVDEALRIAAQVADALDKAHRQGIVHRDLKPGNVMLTKGGAKLLDFGLAKIGPVHQAVGVTAAPTQASLTQAGAVLGTFQYMAPEQLESKAADARTDLFAFGVLLYELVTGRRAFEAESQASLISAIMTGQPEPFGATGPVGPPALERLVTTCLEKDPDERWQSAGDLKRELQWIAGGGGAIAQPAAPAALPPAAPNPVWRRMVPWGVAAVGLLAAVVMWGARPTSDVGVTYLSVGVQPAAQLGGGSRRVTGRTAMTLSADGRSLFFVGSGPEPDSVRLYRRDFDLPEAVALEGTEGAALPFLSPDGQWIGFFTRDGVLMKAPTEGGLPVAVTGVMSGPAGASWAPDDRIVYDQLAGLFQVSADGGTPEALTEVDPERGEYRHMLPRMLPGGGAVLFTVQKALFGWDDAEVVVQSLETGERSVLIENAADARYVNSGHLVFVRSATLMAVPFDVDRLEVTGGAVALLDGVTQSVNVAASDYDTGAAQFDVSDAGDLIYLPGGIAPDSLSTVIWVDRQGAREPVLDEPMAYFSVRISPDGQRLAYTTLGSNRGVWVHDLGRGGTTRLSEGLSIYAIWTPEGQRVVFDRIEAELPNLFWRAQDGSSPTERLTTSDGPQFPASWTPDGQALVFADQDGIAALRIDGDRTPERVVDDGGTVNPALSPDGRWLAYVASDTGRPEVYVQPYPGPGGRRQVSTQGGGMPAWSPDGRELFYVAPPEDDDGPARLTAVDIVTEPVFEPGRPEALFDWEYGGSRPIRHFDVAPDGRFLVTVGEEREPLPRGHLRLIVNWVDQLAERVPRP